MPSLNLCFELQDLAIKFFQVFDQALNQQPERSRQLVTGILYQLGRPPGNVRNSLRNDKPKFPKQTAYLVSVCRSRLDECLAHPVQ